MDITGTFEIAKLELHEGDTLVVKIELILSKNQCDYIREKFQQHVPAGVKVLVLNGPLSIAVLKA